MNEYVACDCEDNYFKEYDFRIQYYHTTASIERAYRFNFYQLVNLILNDDFREDFFKHFGRFPCVKGSNDEKYIITSTGGMYVKDFDIGCLTFKYTHNKCEAKKFSFVNFLSFMKNDFFRKKIQTTDDYWIID